MSEEGPLYNIDDDDLDDSGLNYSGLDDDYLEDNDHQEEEVEKSKKVINPFFILLKILFSPVEGWKTARRSGLSPEKVQAGCFYPLLALLAIANFIQFYYVPEISLNRVVVNSCELFVSYFFGYFAILIFLKFFLPAYGKKIFDSDFGRVFIIYSLSSLCVFNTIAVILPMIWPIVIFLPLWTIYFMMKGCRFFKLPENGFLRFIVTVSAIVIFTPIIVDKCLKMIMPV